MKKVIALLAVGAFALAIVACGKKAEDTSTTTEDTTKVETVTPADTTSTDTTSTDTTKVQ
jgi:ABC-type glycerol-3-phosphate transport system substrate-binding protein